MTLSVIRDLFPQPTPEQELLIGPSCLVLTNGERVAIQSLKQDAYILKQANGPEIIGRVNTATFIGKFVGIFLGTLEGALCWKDSPAARDLIASHPDPKNPIDARKLTECMLKAIFDSAVAGYQTVGEAARKAELSPFIDSPEHMQWKSGECKSTGIFPVLLNYMDRDEREAIEKQIECPITFDWMQEPVSAPDTYVYEKSEILAHLANFNRAHPPEALAALEPEARADVLRGRSPIRGAANMQEADLVDKPDHYHWLFENMIMSYNQKVLNQSLIFAKSQANTLPLPWSEGESIVVDFYSATQEQRIAIADTMKQTVLQSNLTPGEKLAGEELLNAAAAVPALI